MLFSFHLAQESHLAPFLSIPLDLKTVTTRRSSFIYLKITVILLKNTAGNDSTRSKIVCDVLGLYPLSNVI